MKGEKKEKKTLKFYAELTEEEKSNVVYLPQFIQKTSLKSPSEKENSYEISQEKRNIVSLSQSIQKASSLKNFQEISDDKTNVFDPQKSFESTTSTESPVSNTKESSDKKRKQSISFSKNNKEKSPSFKWNQEKKYYSELSEKERNGIIYLPDFSERIGKTTAAFLRNFQKKGEVIKFPFQKPQAQTFLTHKLQKAAMTALASLAIFFSGAAVIKGMDSFSKKIAENKKHKAVETTVERRLAVSKPVLPPPKPSEIIKDIKRKGIKITKAESFQTRDVASPFSPDSESFEAKSNSKK